MLPPLLHCARLISGSVDVDGGGDGDDSEGKRRLLLQHPRVSERVRAPTVQASTKTAAAKTHKKKIAQTSRRLLAVLRRLWLLRGFTHKNLLEQIHA